MWRNWEEVAWYTPTSNALSFGEFYTGIYGDPFGSAINDTLDLAEVHKGKDMASGGQATGWRSENFLQDL